MQNLTVVEVRESYLGDAGEPCWEIYSETEDGKVRHVNVMPRKVVAWRAAEYGLDVEADTETILDILLHECFIGALENDPEGDPAAKAGMVVKVTGRMKAMGFIEGAEVPVSFHTTPDPSKALRAHKLRLDRVKQKVAKITSPGRKNGVPDPLDLIRKHRPSEKDRQECRDATEEFRSKFWGDGMIDHSRVAYNHPPLPGRDVLQE